MTGETCYTQDESVRLKGYIVECEKSKLDLKTYKTMYKRCQEDAPFAEDCDNVSTWKQILSLVIVGAAGFMVGSAMRGK